MRQALALSSLALLFSPSVLAADDALRGTYMEARTCQVYTGPCFANGEVGSTGKDAVMAWQIESGQLAGVELRGLSVAVVVQTSHTLGFNGLADAQEARAIILVDRQADAEQADALQRFALQQTGLEGNSVAAVERAGFEMNLDMTTLDATLEVENFVHLETRKARPSDCICSNESAYYPPLTKLRGFVPGVTVEGEIRARQLGTRWSIPDSRTAYMGTFYLSS